ncbi:hypothetical protein E4H12_01820 [Candidatus Thorarchaeota archaeon]|nr:MAG: hypothetical protein E4H12_01820 [Candidatus Thorarchaeota archaeon]
MKTLIALAICGLMLTGCTDNQRAKAYGGTAKIKKPNPEWQLVTLTWKAEELWTLWYEPSTNKCYFKEDSSFGVIEGTVIVENCSPARVK